jgi:hypothetical protein
MIYKDEAMNVIKTIVIKILVAGIGIQMSRFLTAAILDVSTIATAAVGNLPAHVTSINNSMSDDMKRTVLNWMSASNSQMRTDTEQQKLDKKLQWTLFPTKKSDIAPQENIEIEQIPIQSTITMTEVIDLLMPNAESFA